MLLYKQWFYSVVLTMCLKCTSESQKPTNHSAMNLPVVPFPLPLQVLPHIDPYHGQNQTVQQGQMVYIGCRVYNVGNR